MDNQSIVQQPKPDLKGKAITSLILGVISIILLPLVVGLETTVLPFWLGQIIFYKRIILIVAPLIGILGIIFGLAGLKSTKKNYAIVGIIISVIGTVVSSLFSTFIYYIIKFQ